MSTWSHCPRCAGQLKYSDAEGSNPNVACEACGFRDFASPWPGTTVLLENEEGAILLLKRAIEPKKGFWDTPGGFVEGGEEGEVAARREVFEELGASVGPLTFLGAMPSTYGEGQAVLALCFLGFLSREVPLTLDLSENSEAQWFPLDALPEVAFEDARRAVAALKALRQEGASQARG